MEGLDIVEEHHTVVIMVDTMDKVDSGTAAMEGTMDTLDLDIVEGVRHTAVVIREGIGTAWVVGTVG